MSDPTCLPAQIAGLALDTFERLPLKCKPRHFPNGSKEWTPMSAIALVRCSPQTSGLPPEADKSMSGDVKIVSLATGTKSLPVSMLPLCNGLVLHDCHAEILALRGFNYWLLCEMEEMLRNKDYVSPWLSLNCQVGRLQAKDPPFSLRVDVEVSMFTTEAPCGDASMDLLMASAKAVGKGVEPWQRNDSKPEQRRDKLPPSGRGFFSELGVLRRKPARGDAEISMSMSCTDKLMLRQSTSLLSFPVDLLVQANSSAFLKRLIVYADQYSEEGFGRAFGKEGRVKAMLEDRPECLEHAFHPFKTTVLPSEFRRFSFEKGQSENLTRPKVSNICALWVAGGGDGQSEEIVEVLVNGVKQGFKQLDDRSRKGSVVCRRRMLQKTLKLASMLATETGSVSLTLPEQELDYGDLKCSSRRQERLAIKHSILDHLGGWPSDHAKDRFVVSA